EVRPGVVRPVEDAVDHQAATGIDRDPEEPRSAARAEVDGAADRARRSPDDPQDASTEYRAEGRLGLGEQRRSVVQAELVPVAAVVELQVLVDQIRGVEFHHAPALY